MLDGQERRSHNGSSHSLSSFRIAVDTGGTFTDVVVSDHSGGYQLCKAPTTPNRAFDGIGQALQQVSEILDISLEQLLNHTGLFVYGTTRATNTIVERKVAKTALLLTQGFPDILVLKEGGKFNAHQFDLEFPKPYIPRRYTFEIPERINSEGGISKPLDERYVEELIPLFKAKEFEAIAVSLLWSIANPIHEQRIGEMLEMHLPDTPHTLSHQLNPIVREYRRTSATVIDASLKPLMQLHLSDMENDLRNAGFNGELLISTSFGGVMHVSDVIKRPIYMVKSGPAMAPTAGLFFSDKENLGTNIIVCDTGGTTFDVGLIREGDVKFTRETWLGGQFTGDCLGMSSVDVRSIGAGGGSIAWVDSGGLLRVGPQSAGAVPGPACYDAGGTDPTVTDAAVVLGYIDPDYFLGGKIILNADAAKESVSIIADAIEESLEFTASAIMTLANEHMIKAIGEITVNEGLNPRDSVIVAGGGAAGLNILPIASELGCERVLIPSASAGLSACGAQVSDAIVEFTSSHVTRTRNFDFLGVNDALKDVTNQMDKFEEDLRKRGVKSFNKTYFVEARYLFQVWEIEVIIESGKFSNEDDVSKLITSFHQAHERIYSVRDEGQEIECLNWKGRLIGELPAQLTSPTIISTEDSKPQRTCNAYFQGQGVIETHRFFGNGLKTGTIINGPAIVDEPTTTLVIYPGLQVQLTDTRSYLLKINQ